MARIIPELSIVIPAYQEAARLPSTIGRLKTYLNSAGLAAEVIVVVEKSSDQTAQKAQAAIAGDPRFILVTNKVQKGKGYAVRTGMLRATGTIVFFMDADLSTDLSAIGEFLSYFQAHPATDIIIGSRVHTQSKLERQQSIVRRNMGKTFNLAVQRLVIAGIKDTQCGFKAFRRPAAQQLFGLQVIDGFAFDIEVLALAVRLGYKTAVLPVIWTNSPDSRVKIVKDSVSMLRDAWRIKRRLRTTKLPPRHG